MTVKRVPRSRGALSGFLLILLGAWGALAPFIGPYADFGYTPDQTWVWTEGRGLLQVLPGVATAIAGLILLVSANRLAGALAAGIAALAGAWFVIGQSLTQLWNGPSPGTPLGSPDRQIAEELLFFTGLGVLIVYCAALALGRFAVVGIREIREANREALAAQAPYGTGPSPYGGETEPQAPPAETQPAPEPEHGPSYQGRPDASVPTGRYSLDRPELGDQRVAGPRSDQR